MGCDSSYMEPTPGERIAAVEAKYRAELDKLTRQNCQLREVVIQAVTEGRRLVVLTDHPVEASDNLFIPPHLWKAITRDQAEHRKHDLKRLDRALSLEIEAGLRTPHGAAEPGFLSHLRMLNAVRTADPMLPLEPQLGFNPDSL